MIAQNNKRGVLLMIATTVVFAGQDALSRHLAEAYDVRMVVMIRFWFFGLFALWFGFRQTGSWTGALKTSQPLAQAFRSLLIVAEICIMVTSFVKVGLIESHAIFASYPLLIAALSGPILGEKVGWRRWAAIAVGFVGVLIILDPRDSSFSIHSIWAVIASLMFALYGLMTRFVSRKDSSLTSFVWMGLFGSVGMTVVGIWYWEPMTLADYGWMTMLCITGLAGHYLLIRAYEVAEASAIQPFAYFQLPFASILGILIFSDVLRVNVIYGATIIVAAGTFTLIREQIRRRQGRA